jgi:integrase
LDWDIGQYPSRLCGLAAGHGGRKSYEDRYSSKYALNAEDEERFRLACYSNKGKAARWVLMYCCMGVFGMRVSEMCHIRLNWLEFDKPGEECIRIPREMKCDCHDCLRSRGVDPKAAGGVWKTKMKFSARVIPARINIEAFWLIKKYLEDAEAALKSGWVKRDPVPRDRRKVWNTVRLLGSRAGIEKASPQVLRATAATHIARHRKMTPLLLMHVMGFSSLDTAYEYFAKPSEHTLKNFGPSEYQSRAEKRYEQAAQKRIIDEANAQERDYRMAVLLAGPKKKAYASITEKTCPVCQAVNSSSAIRCRGCGAVL